jgi:hypothetical protein
LIELESACEVRYFGRNGLSMNREILPNQKINTAIQAGLAACRKSPAPIVAIAQLIDSLHLDPTWTDDEVRQVESGMRRVLVRIVAAKPTTSAADAPDGTRIASVAVPERRRGHSYN